MVTEAGSVSFPFESEWTEEFGTHGRWATTVYLFCNVRAVAEVIVICDLLSFRELLGSSRAQLLPSATGER